VAARLILRHGIPERFILITSLLRFGYLVSMLPALRLMQLCFVATAETHCPFEIVEVAAALGALG